jgi:hypothetical protein
MRRFAWKILLLGAALPLVPGGRTSRASSHREAPFVSRNPKVDGTDFYMFRSYEAGKDANVVLIANYIPLEDAYGGPNYFTFDPEALYEIHVDNNGDAKEDITFQFRFQNALANNNNGIALPIGPSGNQKMVGVPFVNVGAVSATNQSSQNLLETYSIKIVRGDRRTGTAQDITNASGGATVFKKPLDNIGNKSIPNYAAYAAAHIYTINIPGCTGTGRVFVGQRKEGFAVNLGQVFDLVNIANPLGSRDQGLNIISDKNVSSLALEIPTSCLTASSSNPIIGGWTTASVRQARVINPKATYTLPAREGGPWAQVSRLSMPLVNELFIGLKDKDHFNSSKPADDAQFFDYVTNPTLPAVLELIFGAAGVRAPTVFPRADLVAAFATGVDGVNKTTTAAEMARLNTAIAVTAAASQNSLGAAACFVNGTLTLSNTGCDPAGFPNGRRPGDDVVDIELRVAMGYLFMNDTQAPSRNLPFTDGALVEASQFDATFPFLKAPLPGSP